MAASLRGSLRHPSPARPRNVAHRGASHVAPENTLAAVRRALADGCDLVEVDVHRSRDGQLVVLHDPDLTRTTDVRQVFPDRAPWNVADFTWPELRRLDAGGWFSDSFTGETVPSLSEVVSLLQGSRAGLLLELKAPASFPGMADDVVDLFRQTPGYLPEAARGRLVVQSFDAAAVRRVKQLLPEVTVGLLGRPQEAHLDRIAAWADQVNPQHLRVDAAYVEQVHRHGMDCYVWTVNRRPAMQRALRMGVDGIITNRPALLRRVLGPVRAGFPVTTPL